MSEHGTGKQVDAGDTWTHGGKSWKFWRESGQFLYVLGDAVGDEESWSPECSSVVKIGITSDPKTRLNQLRQKFPHGVWYYIRWMESSAALVERVLHELFCPWRVACEKEVFRLPYDVYEWLIAGMEDGWSILAKQHRLCSENVESTLFEILPWRYPAEWLWKRMLDIVRASPNSDFKHLEEELRKGHMKWMEEEGTRDE